MGTIDSNSGTPIITENIAVTLFGKTRRAVLALLYSHADESYYFRQIVRITGIGLGALQRELKILSEAGIIQRTVLGNQVYYQANPECPVFTELKNIVMKTVGISDVLKTALAPATEHIRVAFIFGSLAKGNERSDSDVDIIVIGDINFADVVSMLGHVQDTIGREINPIVYSPGEFRSKLMANNHFLKNIMKSSRYFLIGDEHELARLAG